MYLYRAVDSAGDTIDFMLSPNRDLVAAKHFLQLALQRTRRRPRAINVDGHPAYATAISELKQSGELGRRCRCRPSPYLNNVLEQDHRFIKKRIAASLWFRSVGGALNTIELPRFSPPTVIWKVPAILLGPKPSRRSRPSQYLRRHDGAQWARARRCCAA